MYIVLNRASLQRLRCFDYVHFFIPVLVVCSHLNLFNHIAADTPPTTTSTKTKIAKDWQIYLSLLGGIPILLFIGVLIYSCRRKRTSEGGLDGNISLFCYDSSSVNSKQFTNKVPWQAELR